VSVPYRVFSGDGPSVAPPPEKSAPPSERPSSVQGAWFRVYDEILEDPKILGLSPEVRWYYVGILAVFSKKNGRKTNEKSSKNDQKTNERFQKILPNLEEIAIRLRVQKRKAERIVRELIDVGLIEELPDDQGLTVHNWDGRQWTGEAKPANPTSSRTCAPVRAGAPARSETETDTETDTEGVSGAPTFQRDFLLEEEVIKIATERWGANQGDYLVGQFLREYPASWVRSAIDVVFDQKSGRLDLSFLRGVLRRYAREGAPPLRSAVDQTGQARKLNKHEAWLAKKNAQKESGVNPCADFDEE